MKPHTIRFPEDLHTELKRLSKEHGRSFNGEVVFALGRWCRQHPIEPDVVVSINTPVAIPQPTIAEITAERLSRPS